MGNAVVNKKELIGFNLGDDLTQTLEEAFDKLDLDKNGIIEP